MKIKISIQILGDIDIDINPLNEKLMQSCNKIELSCRAGRLLREAGISLIGELVQMRESELLRIKQFGRKSMNEIREALAEMGLAFNMRLDFYPWNLPRHGLVAPLCGAMSIDAETIDKNGSHLCEILSDLSSYLQKNAEKQVIVSKDSEE